MGQITIQGVKYTIPERVPNKPRKLSKQPHTEAKQGLFQFLASLFQENEVRSLDSKTKPLTDGQLEAVVREAFKGFPEVLESIDNCSGSRICKWRWLYNDGRMTEDRPTTCSYRYNEQGKAVKGKVRLVELTLAEQLAIATKYGIKDSRFQAPKRKQK